MAIQQPRPLLTMGKAQTVHLGERTLRDQVEAYLVRMRHALPFPCSAEDTYFGMVPPAMKQWHAEGLFEGDPPLPGRTSNLLNTMFATPKLTAAQFQILHVSVEDQDEYLQAQMGSRGHEGVFWFRAPSHVPLPRQSKTPFFLPPDHPFHDAINDWVEQAFEIEDEIQTSLELMERYQACVKTTAQIVKTWPELNNFVNVKRGLPNNVSSELRDKAAAVLRPTDKENLITQLARAVMLPEHSPPLNAWVKFYTQEVGS